MAGVEILAEQLLRRPLHVVQAVRMVRRPGDRPPPELIVDSPRLLVILSGRLEYVVEEHSFLVQAGQALFVPALVRRRWRSTAGACELVFFSFETDPPLHMDLPPLLADGIVAEREAAAIDRVMAAHQAQRPLVAEGEMKAVLARVLAVARPAVPHVAAATHPHGVHAALRWMEAHFADPRVLTGLHERAGLSLWHFRRMFRRLTGKSPTEHLADLRMRAARFRLSQGTLAVKEVARQVGYRDPLHFSRSYRRFWGHPPSAERERG
jgi:AraC-like DNA-binding protein